MASKKSQDTPILKAETHAGTAVPSTKEKGQPRIVTSARLIQDSKRKELAPDARLNTFDAMLADDSVFTAANYSTLFAVKALARGRVVGTGSSVSNAAADFLNYNLHNMDYGTWYQAVLDMTTALKYGWSDLNIVVRKRNYGTYKGHNCLYKLAPRDQSSVYGWLWNEDMTEWRGFVQKPTLMQGKKAINSRLDDGISELATAKYYSQNFPIILAEQLLHTSYNGTMRNPQGDSPLMHCYDAWYEKKLIETFELSGISKDLNGLPVLRVPSELIERANDPDTYPEAADEFLDLQRDMADIHQGKTTNIVLTSDVDAASGKYLYDFSLIGIQGAGGKNYVTSQCIEQKKKSIYNTFGAGFLLLGQDGSGSYALSSSQTSVHGHLVERDIMQYTDVINNQLLTRLLAANNVYLDWKDMPTFVPADPDELSIDDVSKFIQRVKAVGALTPELLEKILAMGGLEVGDLDTVDFDSKGTSRSGDGMAAGMGNGTSTSVAGDDTSISNNENGGVSKKFALEDGTDRIIDVVTGDCVNEDELDRSGNYKK